MSSRPAAWAPPPKIWISGSGSVHGLGPAEMAPERQPGRRGGRVRRRHRDGDGGVAAEPPLVRRAVELDQPRVDRRLVGGVQADQRRRDDRSVTLATARVTSSPPNAAPPSRRSTASPRAGRGAGRRDRPADRTAGQMQLGLDRRAGRGCPRPAGRAPWRSSRRSQPQLHRPGLADRRQRVRRARCRNGAGDAAHPLLVGQRGHVLDRRLAVDPGQEQAGQQARRARLELGRAAPSRRRAR